MSTRISFTESGIKSLLPEILLKIFLDLDSQETVILRSVCKEFLGIIDNNKSLWRSLVCGETRITGQVSNGSTIRAVEMFDEKSASTLREVTILQAGRGEFDNKPLIPVLHRSKESLEDLSLFTANPGAVLYEVIELAASASVLNSLVLWVFEGYLLNRPKVDLIRSFRNSSLDTERSSKLQVLWCRGSLAALKGELDVSSLVSLADPIEYTCDRIRSFITKFSTTLVHLSMDLEKGEAIPSLSCPSLKILEGRFLFGFPSWLDAPNLQIVIANFLSRSFLQDLPASVQELWLFNWYRTPRSERNLDFLPLVCPQLKILKLGEEFLGKRFEKRNISGPFRERKAKIEVGGEIEGLKVKLLEKLVIPTEVFESSELEELRDLVGEVIDINNYRHFIELEY